MIADCLFRHEAPSDIDRIREVVRVAFDSEPTAGLVDALRGQRGLVLSLVAVMNANVIAHVGFSPLVIGDSGEALALAPVAVLPAHQRQGVGSGLIRFALDECRKHGHKSVIVFGAPAYYSRFGFVPAATYGLACPFPGGDRHFMLLELVPEAASCLRGAVKYRPEFEMLS
jgi:putative acetyltransferase